MGRARKLASDIRWRLKPIRWAGKLARRIGRSAARRRAVPAPVPLDAATTALYEQFDRQAYLQLPWRLELPQIDLTELSGLAAGKSFVDISDRYPEAVAGAFADVVNNPQIAAIVNRYFDGEPWLWNAALNYSDPSRQLTDSQMWHFDYGDVRQVHILVYFSDVQPASGPFTFLKTELSDQVSRHPLFIERLTDAELAADYGIDAPAQATKLCGLRGDVFLSDPGRLLHQGARCETPRLVMFISFTTPTPMSKGGRSVMSDASRAALIRARQSRRVAGALPDHVLV